MRRVTRDEARIRAEIMSVTQGLDKGQGRSTDELITSDGPVKGAEAQRLRNYATSRYLDPTCDLDTYGRSLLMGDLEGVKRDFQTPRRKAQGSRPTRRSRAHVRVSRPLRAALGPHKRPHLQRAPPRHPARVQPPRHRQVAQLPVDGADVSGTTALAHSVSTKPAFDPELARLLYDAGGDVNHRNRYGEVPAHEICMVWDARDLPRAVDALRWFLAHGGNVDVVENSGHTCPRSLLGTVTQKHKDRTLKRVVQEEDARRMRRGDVCCAFCGREDRLVLSCGRCKKARYCAPPRACQRGDWKHHKRDCKT
ncbi:hypothetical protein OE88DRAFT_1218638 [Heliocybe sulcata]|uniref:MYND-type domain-containing protein n=1 Tax=Heliocybe sulcata TaxID=5364 RepID=A0A5C3MVA9_9AGAM|nr:hypothetical protein OE88DRAFT_1218638 [Heliocybe sulcata]